MKWNEELRKYVGERVSCSKFQADGLDTDYYIICEDGSLQFYNELRSLSLSRINTWGDHFSPREKGLFLKALQSVEPIITNLSQMAAQEVRRTIQKIESGRPELKN